ncbi:MAG: hypothetical protein E7050_04735 [Lentisphaerae bacterium]|nr:hypothetical protein [Lentisphaerota bacterium]
MTELKKEKDIITVCFSYSAAPGHKVCLAGVFNDWDPERNLMEYSTEKGVYSCTVQLSPGVYEYKLIVDGEWLLDEGNPNFVSNDFGTLNSIVTVK